MSINDFPIIASNDDFESMSVDEMISHQNPNSEQEWAENRFIKNYYTDDGGRRNTILKF